LFFGNKISKFPEASKMIEHGGAYSVDSAKDMETKFFNVMESDELNKKMGIANKKFIENNVGATNMIYSFITQQCLKKD
jgi:3-deoxy-D-manno-octulosonic-acid transferase